MSMLEEEASQMLDKHDDDIENRGSVLGAVQTAGLHRHFAAGFALSQSS